MNCLYLLSNTYSNTLAASNSVPPANLLHISTRHHVQTHLQLLIIKLTDYVYLNLKLTIPAGSRFPSLSRPEAWEALLKWGKPLRVSLLWQHSLSNEVEEINLSKSNMACKAVYHSPTPSKTLLQPLSPVLDAMALSISVSKGLPSNYCRLPWRMRVKVKWVYSLRPHLSFCFQKLNRLNLVS